MGLQHMHVTILYIHSFIRRQKAHLIEARECVEVARIQRGRIPQGNQRVGVARVAHHKHLDVLLRHLVERTALRRPVWSGYTLYPAQLTPPKPSKREPYAGLVKATDHTHATDRAPDRSL